MAIAHRIYVQEINNPDTNYCNSKGDFWRYALSYAWQMERFRDRLADGVVKFFYIKADGTTRHALGTLNLMLIPTEKHPKGTCQRENLISISYFDLEKGDWRGFRMQEYMQLEDAWTLMPNSKLAKLYEKANKKKGIKEK